MQEDPTCVYVIGQEGGPVKIGMSSNPNGRLDQLKAGACFPLTLFFSAPISNRYMAHQIEQMVHKVYEGDHRHGEWFNLEPYQAIEAIETAIEIEEHFSGRNIQRGRGA